MVVFDAMPVVASHGRSGALFERTAEAFSRIEVLRNSYAELRCDSQSSEVADEGWHTIYLG